jgi:hypothetical protein
MSKAIRYNDGKRKWSLVHFESLEPMVKVLEYGAKKYTIDIHDEDGTVIDSISGKDNWKNQMDLKEILESIQRHLAALLDGQDYDSESGLHHMGHIQCNAMFYNYHYDKESF